ncbi:hypothetical protein L6R50_18865 [Myxococcota bacterium]|nr:hypothetical protein [Myxococcota bacterium]
MRLRWTRYATAAAPTPDERELSLLLDHADPTGQVEVEIEGLTSLRSLSISLAYARGEIDADAVFRAVSALPRLTSLTMDCGYGGEPSLAFRPDTLAHLPGLETLAIRGGTLPEVFPGSMPAGPALRSLKLDQCRGIGSLGALSGLGGLEELEVNGVRIPPLPTEVCALTRLRRLSIHGTGDGGARARMPDAVGLLTDLEVLDLGAFVHVSPRLGELERLRRLTLTGRAAGGAHVVSLPLEAGRLSALEHLELSYNGLGAVPPAVSNLSGLKVLDLSDNRLSALPPDLARLTRLQVLDLGGNRFAAVPPVVWQLPQLRALLLHGNGKLPRADRAALAESLAPTRVAWTESHVDELQSQGLLGPMPEAVVRTPGAPPPVPAPAAGGGVKSPRRGKEIRLGAGEMQELYEGWGGLFFEDDHHWQSIEGLAEALTHWAKERHAAHYASCAAGGGGAAPQVAPLLEGCLRDEEGAEAIEEFVNQLPGPLHARAIRMARGMAAGGL